MTEWAYVEATIAAFIFTPEIRRLADWRTHFDPLNVFAVVPIVMLLPIVLFVYKRRDIVIRSDFFRIALLWAAGFLYALVIGIAQKSLLAGLYGFGLFVLPLFVGAWLVSRPEGMEAAFSRLSRILLIFGAIAGAYGIFQYVVAPPWDTDWMQNIQADSFGLPVPFGIRVYSVLNGPGVFGNFMACALLLNLRSIRISRPLTLVAMLLMLAALILSLVRIAWIALALGTLVTLVLSPDRRRMFVSFSLLGGLAVALSVAFFTFVPSDNVRLQLTDRFSTLTDLQQDASAQDRQESSRLAIQAGMNEPAGYGLGTTGSSGTLKSSDSAASFGLPDGAIDNGFVSRFVEMGYPGVLAFCLSLLLAFFATFRAYRFQCRARRTDAAAIVASMLATQVALALTCIAGDLYSGIGAVLFFIAVGLGLMNSHGEELVVEKSRQTARRVFRAPRFAARP